jgi:hypothetical protein
MDSRYGRAALPGSWEMVWIRRNAFSDGDVGQAVALQNHRTHARCALMGGLRQQSADALQFLPQLCRIFLQQFRHR